jgi:hypothetical protein
MACFTTRGEWAHFLYLDTKVRCSALAGQDNYFHL